MIEQIILFCLPLNLNINNNKILKRQLKLNLNLITFNNTISLIKTTKILQKSQDAVGMFLHIS